MTHRRILASRPSDAPDVLHHIIIRGIEGRLIFRNDVDKQGSVVDLTSGIAIVAAKLGTELRMPMADGIILSSARTYGAVIWTQDSDFEGMGGVEYIAKKSG